MRRETLYLADMIAASQAIDRFLTDVTFDRFSQDDLLQSAVLQKLAVIGEAAARLSPSFRRQFAEIPWADMVSMRNLLVHAYFSVDWMTVWTTAREEVPSVLRQLQHIVGLTQE